MIEENKTKEEIKQEIRGLLLDRVLLRGILYKRLEKLTTDPEKQATEEVNGYKRMFKKMFRKDERQEEIKNSRMYKALTDKEYWLKFYEVQAKATRTMIARANTDDAVENNKKYVDVIDFITSDSVPRVYEESAELKTAQEKAERIATNYGAMIGFYGAPLDQLLTEYLCAVEPKLTEKRAEDIITNINAILTYGDLTKELTKEYDLEEKNGTAQEREKRFLDGIDDQLKPYVYAIKDIRNNAYILLDVDVKEKTEEEEEINEEINKELQGVIPTKILAYPDIFTIADTEMLDVLTTAKYDVDLSVFKKSDETLNSLSHQDREILDYIVLTLYPNNITVFSDYQIATGLYKEQTSETVSDAMLKEINDSINRIRNVRIDEGFISAEKINDIKAEVKINDHLITLRQIDVKHENKTTWYRIIGDPFYYDYAVKTQKINHYKKQLITRNKEDLQIENNIKNETLKMMLARRVISLNYYKQTIISMTEIYDVLGIKDARKYTDARNKTKAMLEDLQKDYNFKYSFKKKGRTTIRLIIERYTDRPLEITKSYS